MGSPEPGQMIRGKRYHVPSGVIYSCCVSRDALITGPIVCAFISLGESQKEAINQLPVDGLGPRQCALGFVVREWGAVHPQRCRPIFGTQIPNDDAPADFTVAAADLLGIVSRC